VSGALELASIERAAGALAQQLDLAELLHRLLSVLLHHTGAQRVVLLRVAADGLFVEASASVDSAERPVVLNQPLEACDDLPHTVLRYVSRSTEKLVLGETLQDGRFARDAYLAHARPRSALCVPVQHGGVVDAIIYLEHRLLPNVFGEERIAAVQLIAAQAAVALENARLHADLRQEVAQRQRVEEALRQALHETATLKDRLQAENLYLQEEIKGAHDFSEMIGESDVWRRVLFKVEQVAATDASVLLLGETGTGKELIARALHGRSRRQAHPLVKVNCAALPGTLIESELFGHEKGAFTGALTRKKGRFELADGGTLFLDEIGDLPLELQAKLLRVLQEGEFERLGSTQTLTVNVRIIAATNRDLAQAGRAGNFRADLYYRLDVFPIELPPLRARPEDIPRLVRYFVTKHQGKLGKQIAHVPDEVMQALTAYAWPGNVRELENVIERALILSPRTALRVDEPFVTAARSGPAAPSSRRLEDLEREHIGQVLAACGRRIKGKGGAAEQLGMKPSTLYTRMRKLGMTRAPG
jgi:transcriptional regulator with GAF, ATPase, and Fis domain